MFGAKTLDDAARRGDVSDIRGLVASGENVNIKTYGETPLHAVISGEYATSKGEGRDSSNPIDHPQVVKTLLESKADPSQKNERGQPVIHFAALYGSSQILKALLENQVNIEQRDDQYNMTPLIAAASRSRPDVDAVNNLQALLEHKADVNAQDKHERTALCQAVRNHFPVESIKTLIEHKADVVRQDENGKTPIHYADSSLVKLLLENKANVNQQDKCGKTPFYETVCYSSSTEHSTVMDILVEHKADVSQPDNEGKAPLTIAIRKGHTQAIKIIANIYAKGAAAGAFFTFFPSEVGMHIGSFLNKNESVRLAQVNKAATDQAKQEVGLVPKARV